MPKKPEVDPESGEGLVKACVGQTLKKFPNVASYLTDPVYEGSNERRELSSLIIRPGVAAWTVILKDPSTGSQLRCQCGSWDDLLPVLEGLLASAKTPWEVDKYSDIHRPKKGKKSA